MYTLIVVNYKFSSSKFNITPLSEKEIIFGYSCSLNRENFNCIVNKIEELLIEFTDDESKNLLSKELNEMKIMMKIYNKEPSLFNLLPVIPKEISDEEIQREMDYSDELRDKLKDFKEEKEERKFEIKELEKTLEWITYNHSNPHIFKGEWEKI